MMSTRPEGTGRQTRGPFEFARGKWGLLIVFVLFGLPLFFGLRTFDLETDEGFYSYSVDRILEAGGWLEPKYSPSTEQVFLEKPPLKFWIVAAPIRLGLLPWDEFGLRFWDALFGSVAFLYVFSLGCMLSGPACGFVSVLLLFVHGPLVFEHGLLTNNMEAPLVLSYCGGVFHFLKWARADAAPGRRHAYAVGLYFVLGFMTKFVAAIFLPAIVVGAALLQAQTRRRLIDEWSLWARVIGVVLALVLPWFAYAQWKFGTLLWEVMLRDHIYTRFTASLDPAHLHPWNYYYTMLVKSLAESRSLWLVAAGLAVLLWQLVRRRSLESIVLVLWMLPLIIISTGSSKLYHYAYPFLPPIMLAAGDFVGLFIAEVPPLVRRRLGPLEERLGEMVPALARWTERPAIRKGAISLIWIAAALAVGTLCIGTVNIRIGATMLIKNSGFVRPIVSIVVIALLARRARAFATLVVILIAASWLPAVAYRQTLTRLHEARHPMFDARQCVLRVEAEQARTAPAGAARRGLFVDTDTPMLHPIFYNFRRVQPWTRQETPSPARLDRTLHDPAAMRPSLVSEARYREYVNGPEKARFAQEPIPGVVALYQYVLLLPGPYAVCAPH